MTHFNNVIPCEWLFDRNSNSNILNIANDYRNCYRNSSWSNTDEINHNFLSPESINYDVTNDAEGEIIHDNFLLTNDPVLHGNNNLNINSRFGYNNSRDRYFNHTNTIVSISFNNVNNGENEDIINNINRFDNNENFIPFCNSYSQNKRININTNNFDIPEEDKHCCICMEERLFDDFCKLNCQHIFCIECINQHLQNKHSCPLCRSNITTITTQIASASDKIKSINSSKIHSS